MLAVPLLHSCEIWTNLRCLCPFRSMLMFVSDVILLVVSLLGLNVSSCVIDLSCEHQVCDN